MSEISEQFLADISKLDPSHRAPVCSLSEKHFVRALKDIQSQTKRRYLNLCATLGGEELQEVECLQKFTGEYPTALVIDKRYPQLQGLIATEYYEDKFLVLRWLGRKRFRSYMEQQNVSISDIPSEISDYLLGPVLQ